MVVSTTERDERPRNGGRTRWGHEQPCNGRSPGGSIVRREIKRAIYDRAAPGWREAKLVSGNREISARLDIASGTLREITVAAGNNFRGADWNPDDVVLFAIEGEGIYRVSALGGSPEKIVSPDPSRFEIEPSLPLFLMTRSMFRGIRRRRQ